MVLSVKNVSVCYMIGDFKNIGLKEWVTRHLTGKYKVEKFMAVNDVSFQLEQGDLLGIVGSNGAGKSTFLKAVSGIMEPTGGSIERHGKIAALLELASGFDTELTVRENAYLRGAMLGYTRKFMDETYDSIIEFAELGRFQDRAFKTAFLRHEVTACILHCVARSAGYPDSRRSALRRRRRVPKEEPGKDTGAPARRRNHDFCKPLAWQRAFHMQQSPLDGARQADRLWRHAACYRRLRTLPEQGAFFRRSKAAFRRTG